MDSQRLIKMIQRIDICKDFDPNTRKMLNDCYDVLLDSAAEIGKLRMENDRLNVENIAMKITNRFELEEAITNAWGIKDDIDLISSNLEVMTTDERLNALHGVSILADLKFQKITDCLDKFVSEKTFQEKTNSSTPFVFDDAFDYELGITDFD